MFDDLNGDEIVEDVGDFLPGSPMMPTQPFVKKGRLPPKKKKKANDAANGDDYALNGGCSSPGAAVVLPGFNTEAVMMLDDMEHDGLSPGGHSPGGHSPPTKKRHVAENRSNQITLNKINDINYNFDEDFLGIDDDVKTQIAPLKLSSQSNRKQSAAPSKTTTKPSTSYAAPSKPAPPTSLPPAQPSPRMGSAFPRDENRQLNAKSAASPVAHPTPTSTYAAKHGTTPAASRTEGNATSNRSRSIALAPLGGAPSTTTVNRNATSASTAAAAGKPATEDNKAVPRKGNSRERTESIVQPLRRPSTFQPKQPSPSSTSPAPIASQTSPVPALTTKREELRPRSRRESMVGPLNKNASRQTADSAEEPMGLLDVSPTTTLSRRNVGPTSGGAAPITSSSTDKAVRGSQPSARVTITSPGNNNIALQRPVVDNTHQQSSTSNRATVTATTGQRSTANSRVTSAAPIANGPRAGARQSVSGADSKPGNPSTGTTYNNTSSKNTTTTAKLPSAGGGGSRRMSGSAPLLPDMRPSVAMANASRRSSADDGDVGSHTLNGTTNANGTSSAVTSSTDKNAPARVRTSFIRRSRGSSFRNFGTSSGADASSHAAGNSADHDDSVNMHGATGGISVSGSTIPPIRRQRSVRALSRFREENGNVIKPDSTESEATKEALHTLGGPKGKGTNPSAANASGKPSDEAKHAGPGSPHSRRRRSSLMFKGRGLSVTEV